MSRIKIDMKNPEKQAYIEVDFISDINYYTINNIGIILKRR